ncbi:MAG: hypothetical protein WAT22_14720 [Saprospiraceae bacterium]|nr:hypothetical protein [Saprospiraceae bacterium]
MVYFMYRTGLYRMMTETQSVWTSISGRDQQLPNTNSEIIPARCHISTQKISGGN